MRFATVLGSEKSLKTKKQKRLATKVWNACAETDERDVEKLYAIVAPKMGFIATWLFSWIIKLVISAFLNYVFSNPPMSAEDLRIEEEWN